MVSEGPILARLRYRGIEAPPSLRKQEDFMQECRLLIEHFAVSDEHKDSWLTALRYDVIPALFGVLLCVLPRLTELRIGNAWLSDFLIFSELVTDQTLCLYWVPKNGNHSFLASALATVVPRLELLEIPADLTGMYFGLQKNTLFDLRRLTHLREVGISMKATQGHRMNSRGPADPRVLFPPTLEVLRISEATADSAVFLNKICLAKKTAYLEALKRVEVYHIAYAQETVTQAHVKQRPHPINDVRAMFKDAGLALYLYFPPCELKTWVAGGTPWSLRAEGDALEYGAQRCLEENFKSDDFKGTGPVFEVEWDHDGDVVMG